MRIYFSENDNLLSLNKQFKTLYITVITKFEERLRTYNNDYLHEFSPEYLILINELKDTLETLKDPEFETFFINLGSETLEKIRYASVSKHSDKCILRAVFDILFKYFIDLEFKIQPVCCDNNIFKLLQIEILKDLRWKIRT